MEPENAPFFAVAPPPRVLYVCLDQQLGKDGV